jgi:chorismate dehydratase
LFKQGDYLNILANKFIKTKVKIPQYILKQYSCKTNITTKQIKYYLTKISYQINHKEKKSLKLFLKLAKETKV